MTPPPKHPWPPIIASAEAPWSVRVRDFLVTLAAWFVLFYWVYRSGHAVLDYLNYRVSGPATSDPDWLELRSRIRPFILLSIFGVLWISLWGIFQFRRLRVAKRVTPPAPLPVPDHAASFKLDPAAVARWRETKVAVVVFDAANHIADVREVSPATQNPPS